MPATTTTTGPCVAPPAQWPVPRLAEQLVMVVGTFTALSQLGAEAATGAGGFAFLGQPAAAQRTSVRSGVAELAAAAAAAGQVAPWMATTTEGGPVSRLADVLGPLPSARQMAAELTPAQVETEMAARGRAMRALGITMDLAPVLDVASPTDPVADEAQRSFSDTASTVAAYGIAFAAGLRSAGVVAVGKHFPGLGHATADTDKGTSTDPPLATLRTDDLVPFAQAIAVGLPVVMVGHPIVPGLTGGLPASLAPATYALLRTTLHFTGVAITDAVDAGAISAAGFTGVEAALRAVEAGADMALVDAATWRGAVSAIEQAISAGTLPSAQVQASVGRILAAKGVPVCSS